MRKVFGLRTTPPQPKPDRWAEWDARFIKRSEEFAAMARRIGENDLADRFMQQAEKVRAL